MGLSLLKELVNVSSKNQTVPPLRIVDIKSNRTKSPISVKLFLTAKDCDLSTEIGTFNSIEECVNQATNSLFCPSKILMWFDDSNCRCCKEATSMRTNKSWEVYAFDHIEPTTTGNTMEKKVMKSTKRLSLAEVP